MQSFERQWATDLLSAFAPAAGPGLAPLPGEVDYFAAFEQMRSRATPLAAFGLRLAVWVLALAPIWSGLAWRSISGLPEIARSNLLARMLVHPVFAARELALLLKLCASMALLGVASVRARSGYDDVQAAPGNQSGVRLRTSERPPDVAVASLRRARSSA